MFKRHGEFSGIVPKGKEMGCRVPDFQITEREREWEGEGGKGREREGGRREREKEIKKATIEN